ncbi:MAG: APC family permease [Egibacteraceae bacterium]
MTDTVGSLKRALIGRPRASGELKHQLLPKWMALPVFSSDPLSSVAYATEEMMKALAVAGVVAYTRILPLSFAVAALLAVVVVSYRQTVRAYPHGGGAYIVAYENLGRIPGLTAASSLLIDYTLTVSVSVAAGVAAITSASQALLPHRVSISIAFVLLVMFANLRGVREAGAIFALPTYAFVATILAMVVAGFVGCLGGCPSVPFPSEPIEAEAGAAITALLLLRAFAQGSTALTGVEAISNGVPAFRYPQSRNAATTLGAMGLLAITMFLGISYLATHIPGVVAFEGATRTVTSQIAAAVFGDRTAGFFLVQIVTAAILILAANTAYADYPRLSSVLATDRFLPRQFLARGDRLVFSNGILALTTLSILLIILFDADVGRLIELYVIGVFTSFTLSQGGMVRHWLRTREPNWRRSVIINGIGAGTTGVVLIIQAYTKFTRGAWIVIAAIPLLVLMMHRINRHYAQVSLRLRTGLAEPERPRPNRVLILEDRVDAATAAALSYALSIGPRSIDGIGVTDVDPNLCERWRSLVPDIPLELLEPSGGNAVEAWASRVREQADRYPSGFTTAVVPETRAGSFLELFRSHGRAQRLKARLVSERGVVVTNVVSGPGGDSPPRVIEPIEHHIVVLVTGVNKATYRALAYAQSLQATSLRGLHINLETENSSRILQEWDDWDIAVPLELVDSPFRSIGDSIREYVRAFSPDGQRTVVTCILPECVLEHWWHRPLHNQTALIIKATLLFERGVVTTSVSYPISGSPADG